MIASGIPKSLRLASLLVPAVLAFGSCNKDQEVGDRVVARAFEEQLLWTDLRQVVPFGISAADSTALAQQYIRNWSRQRAVLHHAELNLSAPAKDFENQLRDYRNSLVIYAYEQALVQQKLDTVVSIHEMEEYHGLHGPNFELSEPIFRARWAKIREGDKRIMDKLERQFLSGDNEQMHELEMWLAQRGWGFVERAQTWITRAELLNSIAASPAIPEDRPLNIGRKVYREGPVAVLMEIVELRAAGEIAPLETVEDDIRSMIINQRKLQLLEQMREDLYREALEQQHIEVH